MSNRNETVVDLVNGHPRPPLKSRWAKNPKPRNSARQNSVLREDIKGNGRGGLGNPCMGLQKELQKAMFREIEGHWAAEKTKEKFTQLRSVMVDRSQSTKFVKQVIINRVITLSICLICALSLFYLYVVDITAPDGRDLSILSTADYQKTIMSQRLRVTSFRQHNASSPPGRLVKF